MSKEQLDMYIEKQEELLERFNGKIIAVSNGECIGAYDSLVDAYRDMVARNLQEGDYIILRCTPGPSAYTSYFANV